MLSTETFGPTPTTVTSCPVLYTMSTPVRSNIISFLASNTPKSANTSCTLPPLVSPPAGWHLVLSSLHCDNTVPGYFLVYPVCHLRYSVTSHIRRVTSYQWSSVRGPALKVSHWEMTSLMVLCEVMYWSLTPREMTSLMVLCIRSHTKGLTPRQMRSPMVLYIRSCTEGLAPRKWHDGLYKDLNGFCWSEGLQHVLKHPRGWLNNATVVSVYHCNTARKTLGDMSIISLYKNKNR